MEAIFLYYFCTQLEFQYSYYCPEKLKDKGLKDLLMRRILSRSETQTGVPEKEKD
jgi:hypothetical protein